MKAELSKNKRILFGIIAGVLIVLLFGALSLARPLLTTFSPVSGTSGDTIAGSQPKVDIRVNKKFDERGNLIEYDSVWTYQSQTGNDSLFGSSKFRFGRRSGRSGSFFDFREPFADTSEWFPRFGDPFRSIDFEEMEREMYRHMQWMDSIMNRMWHGRFDQRDDFFRRSFDDFFRRSPSGFPKHFFFSEPDSFFYHFNVPFPPHRNVKKDTIWY